MSAPTSTTAQPAAETDSDREASVIKGRTSKTQPAASKSTAAKPAPKADPKPTPKAKSDELSPREKQQTVMRELIRAAADLVATWDPKQHAGVSKAEARTLVSARMRYCPSASELWDPRLDKLPAK